MAVSDVNATIAAAGYSSLIMADAARGREGEGMSPDADRLREEILQAQRVRSDLLKWKLVIVGALSAAGLGLAGSRATGHADLVLCAVPLVSLYVDLLAYHLSLRILVIGGYFRLEAGGYEEYVQSARELSLPHRHRGDTQPTGSAFDLEDWAVSWSTGLLSLAVLGYGIYVAIHPAGAASALSIPFLASGAVGLGVTLAAQNSYSKRLKALGELATPGGLPAHSDEQSRHRVGRIPSSAGHD